MPGTWKECTKLMGKKWSFEKDGYDKNKNMMVGDFYVNKRIPAMLNYYKIEDKIETRLAAYNWGIGELKKHYIKHGSAWLEKSPEKIQNYIKKYREN